MSHGRLVILLATFALAAGPALAQAGGANTTPGSTNTATPPGSGTSSGAVSAPPMGASEAGTEADHGAMGTSHHHRTRVSSHHEMSHESGGSGRPSAADHSADQLNAQSLSSIQSNSGGATGSSGAAGGAPGMAHPSGTMK